MPARAIAELNVLPFWNLPPARDSSNTERRTADATVARQDHHGAEQGLALPIRVGNGKQREEKIHFSASSCNTVGRIGIAVTKTDQTRSEERRVGENGRPRAPR